MKKKMHIALATLLCAGLLTGYGLEAQAAPGQSGKKAKAVSDQAELFMLMLRNSYQLFKQRMKLWYGVQQQKAEQKAAQKAAQEKDQKQARNRQRYRHRHENGEAKASSTNVRAQSELRRTLKQNRMKKQAQLDGKLAKAMKKKEQNRHRYRRQTGRTSQTRGSDAARTRRGR